MLAFTKTLCHAKDHQDFHQEYEALSLEAQLNVDANIEAGLYQCMHPAQCPMIPWLPSNPVQLHIAGKVICARLKQHIREAATVPKYLAYVEKRFHWTPEITATINWQAYTQSIVWFRTQRIQITKLCNHLLPAAGWVNQYDTLTTEHCVHLGGTQRP
jgi:hypothetical protein